MQAAAIPGFRSARSPDGAPERSAGGPSLTVADPMADRPLPYGCPAFEEEDLCLPCALGTAGDDASILPRMARRRLRRGEALFHEGDACRSVYAVRSGTFKCVLATVDAREQVTGFQFAGDLLGLDGLAHGRHASRAVALEDSEVVVLPHGSFGGSGTPDLHEILPRLLGRELVRRQKLAALLSLLSAEQRVQIRTFGHTLHDAVQRSRELPNGYEFEFASDAPTYQALVQYIPLERACCPFFEFNVRVAPNGGKLYWSLTGPTGIKDFIREELAWLFER